LNVTMKIGDILGNQRSARVIPGTRTDTIASVHGKQAAPRNLTQIGSPCAVSSAYRLRQRLAVTVRARQTLIGCCGACC
jgi:hypothetical protein